MTQRTGSPPADLDPLAPAGERVLLSLRPSLIFFFLQPPTLFVPVLVLLIGLGLSFAGFAPFATVLGVSGVVFAAFLAILVPEYLSARYVLTERRVLSRRGFFRVTLRDLPLRNLQHAVAQVSIRERIAGAGTIAMASAGTDAYAVSWVAIPDAMNVLSKIREAAQQAGAARHLPGQRGLVIGLLGGIGSGKSEVARDFEELGFVVVDADREAKAALERPEVRAQLTSWWGADILTAEGAVDRRKVADIVFRDPEQRARLESLVHPIVRAGRASLIERAWQEGRRGVVIDAPLLLEAGTDAECDFLVFVDAPLEQRLARVWTYRGWDESEFRRREAAQAPLDEKRRRAHGVVSNAGFPQERKSRVRELLVDLEGRAKERLGANP